MKCPHCRADLAHLNAQGEPIIRNRGLVLKATGMSLVCPKCKGDVPPSQELQKAMANSLILFVKAHIPDHDRHTAGGKVVHVNAHDDKRPARQWEAPRDIGGGATEHRLVVSEAAKPAYRGARKRHAKVIDFGDGTVHAEHATGYVTKHATVAEAKAHAERLAG